MVNEGKYRRWAWGALIGLAAVIVIAGIIMAMTLSAPKPAKETVAEANTEVVSKEKNEEATKETEKDDKTASDDKKTETKPETAKSTTETTPSEKQSESGSVENTSNIPKTGPEEYVLPIIALAVSAYLFAYNVALFKKNA